MTGPGPNPPRACALCQRPDGLVLVFDHPLAGTQLPKGRIAPGESPETAALRELREETGVLAEAPRVLGTLPVAGVLWHLVHCAPSGPVSERWSHACPDDGGHLFSCRWHDPAAPLPPPYDAALCRLAGRI